MSAQDDIFIAEDPKDYDQITLDPYDLVALRKFFEDNDGLSTGELAVLCGRSITTIRRWKRTLGLPMRKSPFKKDYNKAKKIDVEQVTDPAVWDNHDWLYHQYWIKGYGLIIISRMCGKPPETLWHKLKKYGIKIRKYADSMRSKNPYCNEEWLIFNYGTRNDYLEWCKENNVQPKPDGGRCLSLEDCAKIAKVVPYSIFIWLSKFQFHIRDNSSANAQYFAN